MGLFTEYLNQAQAPKAEANLAKDETKVPDAGTANTGGMFKDYLVSKGVATPETTVQSASLAPSKLQSFGSGMLQGASQQFAPRIAAVTEALSGGIEKAFTGSSPFDTPEQVSSGLDGVIDSIKNGYNKVLGEENNKYKAKSDENPKSYFLGQLTGGLPLAIATGGSSIPAQMGVNGALGAISGYGSSEAPDLAGKLTDARYSAELSALFTGIFSSGAKVLSKGPDIIVKNGGNAFKIGLEDQQVLSKPEVQKTITQQLNNTKQEALDIMTKTKQSLGAVRDDLLAVHGDAPTITSKAIQFGHDAVASIKDSVNEKISTGRDLLQKYVSAAEDSLRTSSAGDLDKAALKDVLKVQQDFGKTIFEDGVFQGAPQVERKAIQFWSKLKSAVNEADVTSGSGGDIKAVSDAYDSIYRMQGSKLSGAALKGAVNPTNNAAIEAIDKFKAPWLALGADARQTLAPELDSFITKTLDNRIGKAQMVNLVNQRALGSKNIIEGSIAGLLTHNPVLAGAVAIPAGFKVDALNRLGYAASKAGLSSKGALRPLAESGLSAAKTAGRALSPALGSQLSPKVE